MRARLILLTISAATILSCRTTPDPIPLVTNDTTSALRAALDVSSSVVELAQRAEIHISVARAYATHGDSEAALADGRSVADSARELLTRVGATVRSTAQLVDLARVYLLLEDEATARLLIEEILLRFELGNPVDLPVSTLVETVSAGLDGGEALRDVVRRAIEQVYVVADPGDRARVLLRIAEIYQDEGVGQSVTALLQQAMPALRGLASPWERAEGFSRAALRHHRSGDEAAALRVASDAVAQLSSGASGSIQVAQFRVAVSNLARARAFEQAQHAIDLEPNGSNRAILLAELAAGYRLANRPRDAVATLESARSASLEEGSGAAVPLARIAEEFVALGRLERAHRVAEEAVYFAASATVAVTPLETLERLAAVYSSVDELDQLREYLVQLPDRKRRIAVALAAAQPLIAARLRGVADDLLVYALLQVPEEESDRDQQLFQIAESFARNQSFVFSMRAIERIGDAYHFARALSVLGGAVLEARAMTPNEQQILDQLVADAP